MRIGDRCFVHGYIDEIRKDTVIIKNKGGYFGTDPGEVIVANGTERLNWIPLSEREPDISKSVLICDIEGDIYLGHRTRCGSYYPDFGDDRIKSVIAWMSLPEPYREEEA